MVVLPSADLTPGPAGDAEEDVERSVEPNRSSASRNRIKWLFNGSLRLGSDRSLSLISERIVAANFALASALDLDLELGSRLECELTLECEFEPKADENHWFLGLELAAPVFELVLLLRLLLLWVLRPPRRGISPCPCLAFAVWACELSLEFLLMLSSFTVKAFFFFFFFVEV